MVGQTNLLNSLYSFTLDSFPHSILILGEEGSGKHLISREIANHFNLPLIDLTEVISEEVISDIYTKATSAFYLIDLSSFTEKEQNIMLKLVEEPLVNSYIILINESKINILDTIANRCLIFNMEPYTKEELEQFSKDEKATSLLRTPGQLLTTNLSNLEDLSSLCDKIATKIEKANYSNTLSIMNQINLKDEYDKFDFNLFFKCLNSTFLKYFKETNDVKYYNYYSLTVEETKKLLDKRLNKQYFMYNYLSKLWELSRC